MAEWKGYGDYNGLTRHDFRQYSRMPIRVIKFVTMFPGLTAKEITEFFHPQTRHDIPYYDTNTNEKVIGLKKRYDLGQELNHLVKQGWLIRKKNRGKINHKVFAYFPHPFKLKEIEELA